MKDFWFISDTHFFHENTFAKFKRDDGTPLRPFLSVSEMNETMISRWLERVKPGDHVYHLGDVTMKYGDDFRLLMDRLPGRKRLYLGNHDRLKGTNLAKFFQKVDLWRLFKDHGFMISHLPIHPGSFRKAQFNVHGHLHYNKVIDENGKEDLRYINVSVEHTNFAPVHLDAILTEIKKRGKE
jgi:calcineurin-like phosphoesterase family protein